MKESSTRELQNQEIQNSSHARELAIIDNKTWRKALDLVLQEIKEAERMSRNRLLSITHLEDAIMRLGMDLKDLDTPNPYPNSYKPENTVVDPTADGLKL